MTFYVYIIQSENDGTCYIGSMCDLHDGLECHNQRRSKYTKLKFPWKLICYEKDIDPLSAIKRESHITSLYSPALRKI